MLQNLNKCNLDASLFGPVCSAALADSAVNFSKDSGNPAMSSGSVRTIENDFVASKTLLLYKRENIGQ